MSICIHLKLINNYESNAGFQPKYPNCTSKRNTAELLPQKLYAL